MNRLPLKFAEVWYATLGAVRRDFGIYATIAAAFVLLPAVVESVFGPAQPTKFKDITPAMLLPQLVLAVIACVAQVAIARLALRGGSVAQALRTSVQLLPRALAAVILGSFVLVPPVAMLQATQFGYPGLAGPALVLVVPGFYALARLSLALPLIAATGVGPIVALQLSWAATAGNGWRVLLLLFALIVMLLGLSVLAAAVASAVGSILVLAGGKVVAGFFVALVSAVGASLYTLWNSVMLAELCRRLAPASTAD